MIYTIDISIPNKKEKHFYKVIATNPDEAKEKALHNLGLTTHSKNIKVVFRHHLSRSS